MRFCASLAPRKGCCACLLSPLAGRCWASPADSRHPLRAVPEPDPPILSPACREGFGYALPRQNGWLSLAQKEPGYFLGVLPARGTPNPLLPSTLRTGAVSIPTAGLFPIAGSASRCPQPEQGLHPKKAEDLPVPSRGCPASRCPRCSPERCAAAGRGRHRPAPAPHPAGGSEPPAPVPAESRAPRTLPTPLNPPHNRSPFAKPFPARRVRCFFFACCPCFDFLGARVLLSGRPYPNNRVGSGV